MKLVHPSHEILFMPEGETILKTIELAGRTCYKSEDLITDDSAAGFMSRILKSGHHSVIEHMSITVRFICDRGVTHELVRHRLAAYSQESTRYANYSKDKFGSQITVVIPPWYPDLKPGEYVFDQLYGPMEMPSHKPLLSGKHSEWLSAMFSAEETYLRLLEDGELPQQARSVLPNSLKTEIVMTANLREWRHVFGLRCSRAAHQQIQQLMLPLLAELSQRVPVVFDDLAEKFKEAT